MEILLANLVLADIGEKAATAESKATAMKYPNIMFNIVMKVWCTFSVEDFAASATHDVFLFYDVVGG